MARVSARLAQKLRPDRAERPPISRDETSEEESGRSRDQAAIVVRRLRLTEANRGLHSPRGEVSAQTEEILGSPRGVACRTIGAMFAAELTSEVVIYPHEPILARAAFHVGVEVSPVSNVRRRSRNAATSR